MLSHHRIGSWLSYLQLCLVLFTASIASAQTSLVITTAGGYVGDGQLATNAPLTAPLFVTEDSKGNLYISDQGNNRIQKVTTKGVMTTIAGNGIGGFAGDGGSAKLALIADPAGIAIDSAGDIFFSDLGNRRVRKIDTTGIITTFAGGGFGGDGGPAVDAELIEPTALTFDSAGNLFIADVGGPTIRMVDTSGIIHTVAGVSGNFGFGGDGGPATSAELFGPEALAFDHAGNLFIADSGNSRIRKVDPNGIITTFAGNGTFDGCPGSGDGGPADSASVPQPKGIVVQQGRLLIADECWRIRSVDLNTNVITSIAGANVFSCFNGDGHAPLSTDLCRPTGLALDTADNLIESEWFGGRVRRIGTTVQTIAGGYIGDGGPATKASLIDTGFASLSFDSTGNLYIADVNHMRVRKVNTLGVITTFAGTGISGYSGDGGAATSATFNNPAAVVADHSGNVYIADGNVIRKVDSGGVISTFFSEAYLITSLAADLSGNIYAANTLECVIWKLTPSGSATIFAGIKNSCGYNGDGIAATTAQLHPLGVATDSKGNVFIADDGNYRIRMVNSAGIITTVAGNGTLGFGGDGGPATSANLFNAQQVAVDVKGNIFIADALRVRMVDTSGTINTIAGTLNAGYNGNGLPATQTNVSPQTVTLNSHGIVYMMDADGYRVRKITKPY